MKPDYRQEARRWFRQAESDLDDARFVLQGGRYSLTCFLCQQAAEKALKGLLYRSGAEDVWGHSVADLCHDAAKSFHDIESLVGDCASLDKYYIPTRYPDSLPGGIPAEAFDKFDAERAMELAQKVLDEVRRWL